MAEDANADEPGSDEVKEFVWEVKSNFEALINDDAAVLPWQRSSSASRNCSTTAMAKDGEKVLELNLEHGCPSLVWPIATAQARPACRRHPAAGQDPRGHIPVAAKFAPCGSPCGDEEHTKLTEEEQRLDPAVHAVLDPTISAENINVNPLLDNLFMRSALLSTLSRETIRPWRTSSPS